LYKWNMRPCPPLTGGYTGNGLRTTSLALACNDTANTSVLTNIRMRRLGLLNYMKEPGNDNRIQGKMRVVPHFFCCA